VRLALHILIAAALATASLAQPNVHGAIETQFALERLNVTASALMIAAHPDDENTAVLAWLARGLKVRTGYLSLTRGEGGQNVIGPEQGRLLGVIRTQELLAARRIDGAEQFFTRAVDFGYSKTADETLAFWGREQVLGDIVRVIRTFRPDVIILRFSGTARDGHGHHQTSAILGKEAFEAAADPTRFSDQLRQLRPWQAKRIVWNAFRFTPEQEKEIAALPGRVEVDAGEFDPLLGYSYAEIAGQSRSMHRSQAMGTPQVRGPVKETFAHVAGQPAERGLFDGVQFGWTNAAGPLLKQAAATFDPRHPERTLPLLVEARPHVGIDHTRRELDDAVMLCAGLWLDASADRPYAAEGDTVQVRLQAISRSRANVSLTLMAIEGGASQPGGELTYNVPKTATVRWLARAGAVPSARFRVRIGGEDIEIERPIRHRYVDSVRGELTRPLEVVPAVSAAFARRAVVFPSSQPRPIEVQVRAYRDGVAGELPIALPSGWTAEPRAASFKLGRAGEQTVLRFRVTPPESEERAEAALPGSTVELVEYPHIDPQAILSTPRSSFVRADVKLLVRRVGYIMGAGDLVPDALAQLGCEVTLLNEEDLARGDLSRFDAIITGVRAYNVRRDLRANHNRLIAYLANGGTLVVQYNVLEGRQRDSDALRDIGPFPIRIGRDRISVEQAPVEILRNDHPLLNSPNRITSADFEGWVQERGLYFAASWDPRYETIIASHDPGERPLAGGILFARHGKGSYVFTSYSWFRQLPAGVPGAYRIFANLLSAGNAR
jgi:LmbE family N-acetylglucosaminyl deacetylase